MTEAPFVDTLMKLGMGKGTAFGSAFCGARPEFANMLAIGRLFGVKRAVVYIATIVVLSTLAGVIYGEG